MGVWGPGATARLPAAPGTGGRWCHPGGSSQAQPASEKPRGAKWGDRHSQKTGDREAGAHPSHRPDRQAPPLAGRPAPSADSEPGPAPGPTRLPGSRGLTRNKVAVLLLLLVRELGAGLRRGAAALRDLAVARGLVAGLAEPRVGGGPLGGDGAAAREPAHTHRTRGAT